MILVSCLVVTVVYTCSPCTGNTNVGNLCSQAQRKLAVSSGLCVDKVGSSLLYLLGEGPLQAIQSEWSYPSKTSFHFVFCHRQRAPWNMSTCVCSSQRNQSSIADFQHGPDWTCHLCACLVYNGLSNGWNQTTSTASAPQTDSCPVPFEVVSCHHVFSDVNST